MIPAPRARFGSAADLPEARRYWEERARRFADRCGGLPAVCSYGMPDFYNRAIAFCQRRALEPWLSVPRTHSGAPGPPQALDVGCGVGRWSLELARRGYRVTGVDLSSHMVAHARAHAAAARADCDFTVGDVGDLSLAQRFDLILCVTVLQHVLEPGAARRAVGNLAAHLKPAGRLVLLEAAPTRSRTRCDTAVFTARTLGWYENVLRASGLRLLATRGVDPMPFKTWLLPHYRRLPPVIGTAALAFATALALPLDLALASRASALSWHKVLVACREEEVL